MEHDVKEKYILAGRIAGEVREAARTIVKPGVKHIDIADKIEAMIRSRGGQPAFPVNISINDIAAHHTPTKNDAAVIKENDIADRKSVV